MCFTPPAGILKIVLKDQRTKKTHPEGSKTTNKVETSPFKICVCVLSNKKVEQTSIKEGAESADVESLLFGHAETTSSPIIMNVLLILIQAIT